MRKTWSRLLIAGLWAILAAGASGLAAENQLHRLGAGANYWRTIDRIKEDDYKLDDDGLAWLATYQFAPWRLVKFQADLEIFPTDSAAWMKPHLPPRPTWCSIRHLRGRRHRH